LVVVAAGRAAQRLPGFSTVDGFHRDDARAVDNLGVGRIDSYDRQIAAADAQRGTRIRSDARPTLTAVVRAEYAQPGCRIVSARLGGSDDGVDRIRLAGGDGDIPLRGVLGQPVAEALPGIAAVRGLEQSSRGALKLVLVFPGAKPVLPQPG